MSKDLVIEVSAVEAGHPEDLGWAKRVEELQLNALPNIRATAERWAASLTGLLGAVGLAALLNGTDEFDKLNDTAQAWSKGAFFAAAVVALLATLFAVAAAQGTSRRVFLPGAGTFREASEEAVEKAVGQLRASRWLAALAVASTLLAAAWLWWGGSDPTDSRLIRVEGCTASAGASATEDEINVPEFVVRCRQR